MRFHYYNLVFFWYDENGAEHVMHVYHWANFKLVSCACIVQSKINTNIPKDAVLMSCSYLGKMSKREFETGLIRTVIGRIIDWFKEGLISK